jgi:hypothetical protein
MTSTGTYSATLNTYQIISGALRLLGAIQTGETVEADEYSDSLEALNALTKFWQSTGIHVWSEVDCHLFLNAGQTRYVLQGDPTVDASVLTHATVTAGYAQTSLTSTAASGATSIAVASNSNFAAGRWAGVWLDSGVTSWARVVSVSGTTIFLDTALAGHATSGAQVSSYVADLYRPLRVPAARRYQYAAAGAVPIEVPLMVMSRIDYANVPNKATPGIPTQYFYDPSMNAGSQAAYSNTPGQSVFYVWPAPSNNQNAIRFTAQRPLQDFTTQANTADLPQEWISTLRYNLAVELAPEYDCAPQRFQMIKLLAEEKLATSMAWDREPESVMFGVSMYPASRT